MSADSSVRRLQGLLGPAEHFEAISRDSLGSKSIISGLTFTDCHQLTVDVCCERLVHTSDRHSARTEPPMPPMPSCTDASVRCLLCANALKLSNLMAQSFGWLLSVVQYKNKFRKQKNARAQDRWSNRRARAGGRKATRGPVRPLRLCTSPPGRDAHEPRSLILPLPCDAPAAATR